MVMKNIKEISTYFVKAFTKLEKLIENAFCNLGKIIGSYPWAFLLGPLIISIIAVCGFSRFGEVNDIIEVFTPVDSPTRHEFQVMREFHEMTTVGQQKPHAIEFTIQSKKVNSILNRFGNDSSMALLKALDFIQKTLTVRHRGRQFSYHKFCKPFCQPNLVLRLFIDAFTNEKTKRNTNVVLKFPTSKIFGVPIYVGNLLFSVETDNSSIISVRMVKGTFSWPSNLSNKTYVKKWKSAVHDYFLNLKDPHFDVYVVSSEFWNAEMRHMGLSAIPFLTLALGVVIIFSVLTTLRSDCAKSKPLEVIAGVASPVLATITSFGFLIGVGLPYQPIVTISLFLIIGIGVDDMFIMLHAWHNSEQQSTNVEDRLAESLRSSGPSMTITSLTNVISFAIGISTSTPAIRSFCLFTSTALLIDYVFQITYFTAVLSLSGRRSSGCCLKQENGFSCSLKIEKYAERLLKTVSEAFSTNIAGLLLSVGLLLYWSVSLWGCTQIKVDLDIGKLLLDDSPYQKLLAIERKLKHEEMDNVVIIISNPGDLANKSRRNRVTELVEEFENIDNRYNVNGSTIFWLRSYQKFIKFFDIQFAYRYLKPFLRTTNHAMFSGQLNYNWTACEQEQPSCVINFLFIIGFQGTRDWPTKVRLISTMRSLLKKDRYRDLKGSLFYSNSFIIDQLMSIGPTVRITFSLIIASMALVCSILTPNLIIICLSVASIMSINFGVLGLLVMWNVDLDPILMAGLLMSMGFSVDFTAHTAYHYYKIEEKSSTQKLLRVYKQVAKPMLQAGISTILSLSVLAVSLGLIHGLVVLPIGLSLASKLLGKLKKERVREGQRNDMVMETL